MAAEHFLQLTIDALEDPTPKLFFTEAEMEKKKRG
jgi:hypothetical protein